jgi:site-specific DNA-cytosine methylase
MDDTALTEVVQLEKSGVSGVTEGQKTCLLKQCLSRCLSFEQFGCALAWFAICGSALPALSLVVQEFVSLWLHEPAKTKSSMAKRRGVTFPIREGELASLVQVFTTLAPEQCTEAAVVNTWSRKAWVYVMVCALNRLAGKRVRPEPGHWGPLERRAVASLEDSVKRRADPQRAFPTSEELWQKDVGCRRIGYNGEEQSICHELTWEQVLPALPPKEHGGCIDCLLWVSPRTREFLTHPEWLLKREEEVNLPKMPGKIHVRKADKMRIALELVARNVCDWIPLSKVHEINGVKVLNGLFGVAKPVLLDNGQPVLGLIMNLTGSNATQLQMEGGCSGLPSITAWQSAVVGSGEEVKLHQSDMCSAFYLFKLPPQWRPYLAFNVLADGSEFGGISGINYALCCSVIPMGWLNSVGVMQEVSENLLLNQGLRADQQISRGRTVPPWLNTVLAEAKAERKSWWHVYLDNYAGGERVFTGETALDAQLCHDLAERAWATAGVVSSDKKRVIGAEVATELGAELNGEFKTLGLSTEKLVKLLQATGWMLSQDFLSRKHVQILAGRWIFALQFRRPGMSYLQRTWEFVSGAVRNTSSVRSQVKAEFVSLMSIAPLLHCNLGAEVSESLICTDASEKGGSVEAACELTAAGQDFLGAVELNESSRTVAPASILVVSLFNGIGGAFRSYDILGVEPVGRIAVELDDAANRVTLKRWPGVILVKDVRSVTREVVKSWSLKFLQVSEIHLWGGWPCVDLSAVKFGRKNLEGEHSSLFWEIPRVRDLLVEEFGNTVVLKYALENVASMDESAAREISQFMEKVPYKLDCADAVPMRRPRFCWTSEQVEGHFPDVTVEKKRYWKEVTAKAPYPEVCQWLTEGYHWEGGNWGTIFPTCLKSIPRNAPPPRPAGLQKCDAETRKRWQEDSFRYPPYQYQSQYIITNDSAWRLINAEEKELLLGYGFKHTALAWSASQIKQNKLGYSDTRHRLLGDSFSIYSFVIIAAIMSRQWIPQVAYEHLAKRMGMAPGFRAALRSVIPSQRSLSYGCGNFSGGLLTREFSL